MAAGPEKVGQQQHAFSWKAAVLFFISRLNGSLVRPSPGSTACIYSLEESSKTLDMLQLNSYLLSTLPSAKLPWHLIRKTLQGIHGNRGWGQEKALNLCM